VPRPPVGRRRLQTDAGEQQQNTERSAPAGPGNAEWPTRGRLGTSTYLRDVEHMSDAVATHATVPGIGTRCLAAGS
jgi:hypothetical protein